MEQDRARGQSATIALVLVMALALATALLLVTLSTATLQSSQQYAETEKGESTLTELDSKASLVALGGGDGVTMQLGLRGGTAEVRETGRLRMVLEDNGTTTELTNTSLGTVEYANGDSRIAYQGGGVWRRNAGRNESVMVSPPEVHYRQGTLTLPLIRVTGDEGRLSTAELRAGNRTDVYPRSGNGSSWRNPVDEGSKLVLYVESDYYRGWAAFFEQRIGANTTVFPGNETVRVELVSPTERSSVDSGLISVGTGSPIDMRGNAGDPTFVDSYDSGIGPYSTSSGSEGSVRSPSGLNLGGESFIKGDVNTGGVVDFDGNNNTVYGHVRHQGLGHKWKKSGTITEWEARNGSDVSIPPIDSTVNRRVGAICDGTNDLSVSGRTVVVNGSSPYCVDGDLTVGKGDELVIDLSSGSVSLAVTGNVEVSNGGEISVVGTGGNRAAELWMAGDEVTVRDADVTVSNDRSPAFRLFAGQGTSTAMRSQATFTGLLYTPTTQEAGGGLAMRSQSHLYGSAVVGEVAMRSGSAVHYDMAVSGFQFERRSTAASRLSYLYVTINEVTVDER